jgi:hypothetical protein
MRFLVTLIFLLLAAASEAATNTLPDFSSATVQDAFNTNTRGDTIIFPIGTNTWNTDVDLTNWFHIIGQSTGNQINGTPNPKTKIIMASDVSGIGFGLHLKSMTNDNYTNGFIGCVEGITIQHSSGANDITLGGTPVGTAGVHGYIFTNVMVTNISTRGVSWQGDCAFVFAGCTFFAPGAATIWSGNGEDDGGGSFPQNPKPWANAFRGWGTRWGGVFENSGAYQLTTIANGALDNYFSGEATVRFCLLTNGNIGGHGLDSSGSGRSPLRFEVYGNTNYGAAAFSKSYYNFRGGTLTTCSNWIFTGNSSDVGETEISYYRTSGTNNIGPLFVCCNPWGPMAGGTNHVDGNIATNGYPGLDQMGFVGPTTFGLTNSVQTAMPLYSWSNYIVKPGGITNDVSTFIHFPTWTNGNIYHDPPGVQPEYDGLNLATITWSTNNIYAEGREFFSYTPRPGWVPLAYPHPYLAAFFGTNGGGGGAGGAPSRAPNSVKVIRR